MLTESIAFLKSPFGSFYARAPRSRWGIVDSATLRLMNWIWLNYPENAQKILRSTLLTTDRLSEVITPFDWGLTKVAGKRIEFREMIQVSEFESGAENASAAMKIETCIEVNSSGAFLDRQNLWMRIQALENTARKRNERFASDRPLAALWLSEQGETLSVGVNRAASNRLEHAELRATLAYQQKTGLSIPRGAVLYCSLKPCRMCAGAIVQAAEDPATIRVVYRDFDPGPNARETVLNEGSFDRKRLGEIASSWGEIENQLPDGSA